MLAHRFAFDDFIRIVVFECERLSRIRSFEFDFGDFRERRFHVFGDRAAQLENCFASDAGVFRDAAGLSNCKDDLMRKRCAARRLWRAKAARTLLRKPQIPLFFGMAHHLQQTATRQITKSLVCVPPCGMFLKTNRSRRTDDETKPNTYDGGRRFGDVFRRQLDCPRSTTAP
jgi:hypothetical protein